MVKNPSKGSITEDAYHQIRADLLACRLLPGERLKTSEICQKMGVSLGAVREALARLTSEGLVVNEPQRGYRAAPISVEDLQDLTEARVEIEALCLRSAVQHGDLAWETRIVAAAHKLAKTPKRNPDDPSLMNEAWYEADTEFHEALAAGCPNQTLLQLRRQLRAQSERYKRLSYPLATPERNVDRGHKEMTKAAIERNADKVVEVLTTHIFDVARILKSAIERTAIKGPPD